MIVMTASISVQRVPRAFCCEARLHLHSIQLFQWSRGPGGGRGVVWRSQPSRGAGGTEATKRGAGKLLSKRYTLRLQQCASRLRQSTAQPRLAPAPSSRLTFVGVAILSFPGFVVPRLLSFPRFVVPRLSSSYLT